jgi:hypothetical protein
MSRAVRFLILIPFAAALFAQGQPAAPNPAAQSAAASEPAGIETPWEIAPVLQEIGAHATRLQPELDKIDVKSWLAKGAPDTYAAQLQSSKDQARAIAGEAVALSRDPEKLSVSLQLFFRIQGLEAMLGSLEDGLRRYQSPAAAQQLAALEAENGANRDRLQSYIVSLAAQQEQEYKVMDREAQRCRGILTTPVSPARATGRKK